MIGDSLKADIAGAQNAGLAACWCDYAGRGLPEGTKATHVIRNLEELYRIVMEPEAKSARKNKKEIYKKTEK